MKTVNQESNKVSAMPGGQVGGAARMPSQVDRPTLPAERYLLGVLLDHADLLEGGRLLAEGLSDLLGQQLGEGPDEACAKPDSAVTQADFRRNSELAYYP